MIVVLVVASYVFWGASGLVAAFARTRIPDLPVALFSRFDGERAYNFTATFALDFPGRVVGTLAGKDAANWTASVFRSYGLDVTLQSFPTADFQDKQVEGVNVIAVSRGTSSNIIALMAHRDVVPSTEQGANDNGSGSGVLLEIARVFASAPHNFTLAFISTDSEETNLQGAAKAVEALGRGRIVLGISIDQLGSDEGAPLYIYAYSHRGEFADAWPLILALNLQRRLGFQVQVTEQDQILQRMNLYFYTSDSEAFVSEDIPAFAIGEYVYPEGHTLNDTIGKISARRLEYAGTYLESYLVSLDQMPIIRSTGSTYFITDEALASQEAITIHASSYVFVFLSNTVALLVTVGVSPRRMIGFYLVRMVVLVAYVFAIVSFARLTLVLKVADNASSVVAAAFLVVAVFAGALVWRLSRKLGRRVLARFNGTSEQVTPTELRALGAACIGLAIIPYMVSDPLTATIVFGPIILVGTQGTFLHGGRRSLLWVALIISSLAPLALTGLLRMVTASPLSLPTEVLQFMAYTAQPEFYVAAVFLPPGLHASLRGRRKHMS